MTRTDLSSSAKLQVHTRISLRRPLRCGFTILLCSCLFAGAAQCRSRAPQDVAEAARQESTRKDATKTTPVYTDEDLRRARILTPDDEARAEARRQQQPAHVEEQVQAPIDADGQLAQLPLGDIARRYRNAKPAAQVPDPFHLPLDEPVFAAPVITVPLATSRPSFSPAHPNPAPSRHNTVVAPALSSPSPLHRVDPFMRRLAPPAPNALRPKVAPPIAPSVRPPTVAPATTSTAPKASVAASIAPQPAVKETPLLLRTVTMQRGDSLWKLAKQNLGRGSRWPELLAANPGTTDFGGIAAGTEIVVPAKLTGLKSDLKVTLKEGDTLSRIAQSKYGHATAWRCIAQANPEIVDH